MGLRIATNVQSLVSQRHLATNTDMQRKSLEHLASGSRIDRASDDAAGLAISEKMRAQIRSIRQDVRNANDGISMIQTAEGGMNEIGNILIRLRELSIQGSTDTIGDVERGFMDKEVQQLKAEVTRISSSTEFNGKKLLLGEGDALELQVGTHNNPLEDRFQFDPSKTNATLDGLGIGSVSTVDRQSSQSNLEALDEGIKTLVGNRAELGALQNRLQSTVNNLAIYDENLSNANSRIRDTDMAFETSELTKNNILTQANVSVLSQANQNNMMALKLLG